jgi:hypothetical protein
LITLLILIIAIDAIIDAITLMIFRLHWPLRHIDAISPPLFYAITPLRQRHYFDAIITPLRLADITPLRH